ncbi:MAG TPA: hypothetical protein VMZ91_01100, partial [Candidatus Paceibacterota bacterium]|nr:hypothetical protein [Candidatus Paceibacterota bacterium]
PLSKKNRISLKNQSILLIAISIVYFLLCVLLYLKIDTTMAFAMLGMAVIYVVTGIIFLNIARN